MKTKNLYQYPMRKEDVIRTDTSSPAHEGKLKYAVDFLCKEGSRVHVAYDGEIVEVLDNKKENTLEKEDMNDAGNFILVKHENGEYSHYAHFRYNGILKKKGDKILQGDLLGFSGNTGFSYGPHLHFSVIKFTGKLKDDFESLEIRWKRR